MQQRHAKIKQTSRWLNSTLPLCNPSCNPNPVTPWETFSPILVYLWLFVCIWDRQTRQLGKTDNATS